MAIRLIINADDFGLTQGVNAGIIQAHVQGVLTSATLMANGLAWEEAVSLAKEHPRLGVGVHLTLTALRPVLDPSLIPSLVDGKGFLQKGRWRLPLYNLSQVKSEWAAQIHRLQEAGLNLTHLDSHHHSHLWPSLTQIAVELAREYNVPALRLISPQSFKRMGIGGLDTLVAWRSWHLASGTIPHPLTVLGLEAFPMDRSGLESIIASLPPGVHELFCHPGRAGDLDLLNLSSLREQRVRELELLCSPWFREILAAKRLELVNYSVYQEGS